MNENQAWITLFRRIPAELHDVLALGMTTGAEIVIQKIIKLEPDFMTIRGRLAGTQDTGRVIMVPYNKLTFVAVQRDLKDAEIESIFGKAGPVADLAAAPKAEPKPEAAEPAEPATTKEAAAPVNGPKKPAPLSKSALLARLRDRLKESGK